MSLTVAAAGAGAVALWAFYNRQLPAGEGEDDDFVETHANAHAAPRTWYEDLYFLAEGLR